MKAEQTARHLNEEENSVQSFPVRMRWNGSGRN